MNAMLLLLSAPTLADTACPCDATGTVLINEFLPDPGGSDGGNEWVELTSSTGASLCGWEVQWGTSSFNKSHEFDGGTIEAGGYFVFGGGDVTFADVNGGDLAIGNAGSSSDALRVVACDGSVADVVVYGSGNDDGWTDEAGATVESVAPKAGSDESVSRAADGVDTNLAGDDFCLEESPTPGAANNEDCGGGPPDSGDTGLPSDCLDPGALKINELMPDPDGSDDGNEFIELINVTGADVDLDGWELQYGTSSFSKSIALAGTVAAGGFFVVGDANVQGADFPATLSLGNAGSSSDAVRLTCEGSAEDTVIYGSPNSDEWVNDTNAVADSLASKPGGGESLHRIVDGVDTDRSGDDFCVQLAPTVGGASECPICVIDGRDDVKLNELLSNPEGTDGNREWVELVNLGTAAVSLDAWTIEVGKSSWGGDTFPTGTVIEAGGHLLIAGQGYDGAADVVIDGFDLGNASTSDDGVRLVDCEGAVVDTVLYGPDDVTPELEDDAGSAGSLAPVQDDDESIGRYPDGADSDDHAVDWSVYSTPTPGEANSEPASGDTGSTGGERPGGCNCGEDDVGGERPEGQCSAAPSPTTAAFGVFALAMFFVRRRR
ncbi:MAG: lamin tail domain-containing protein [Proteobacteria bacterium]|nr:lamin tail domain-containing protein [Pseudomonadota bacterium]MCP4919245.1 lamin tail domain-containing protein [Pseudomonadota bacterium]